MARELPYIAAIDEAIKLEMERDDTVLYFGQNMATTENEPFVDAVRPRPRARHADLRDRRDRHRHRRRDGRLPAGRRALHGRVHARRDGPGVNEAPRFRYMSGGQVKVPLVLKAGYGFAAGWAGQHTGSLDALFMGVPGLKVAVPTTAADAKGLMATAIRDDNPVVYLHHYLLTLEHGEVPDGEHLVPFGEAAVRRTGGDVTIVGTGWTVGLALAAAERLADEGIEAEVIDPRTLAPLDLDDDPRVGREDRPSRARRPGAAPQLGRRRSSPPTSPSTASARSRHRSGRSPRSTRRCPTASRSRRTCCPTRTRSWTRSARCSARRRVAA